MASPPPSDDLPSHRACAHCRSQKVRCLPDDNNPDICSRCAKSGRPCIFTPLQKRKQRKRTDTRVAELEREMRAMRALLKSKSEGSSAGGGGSATSLGKAGRAGIEAAQSFGLAQSIGISGSAGRVHDGRVYEADDWDRARDGLLDQAMVQVPASQPALPPGQQKTGSESLWPERLPQQPSKAGQDVIDRGLLSMATARQLVETYRSELFVHYPTVPIPGDMTADELRSKRPTLFLAIIASASGKDNPELSATLDKEVLEAYATKSLMRSEKSLELVQALLISAVWYHPPGKFGQLKYYEYIHMAATMAMDIGIGTRPKIARQRFGNAERGREPAKQALVHPAEDASNPDLSMTPRSRDSSPDTGNLESRRTFLACYMICAGVSLSLRRPNMLRVSSYVRECVQYLDLAPDAIPTDRTMVHWVRLVMIAEEIGVSFSYDDPGGIASITELRTQLMLKDFESRLTEWWTSVPEHEGNGSMTIMYYWVRLFLHEVILHVDHSPEDFRAPYQMGPIHPWNGAAIPTQVLAESIAECIASSHALLNAFFVMDVDHLRALPVFSYVRISFAAFVLAKLCLSASRTESRISHILDSKAMQSEMYMDRAVLHVRNIVGENRCRVPAIFLALLFKLRQWCLHPQMIEPTASVSKGEKDLAGTSTSSKAFGLTIKGSDHDSSGSGTDESPQSVAGQAGGSDVTPDTDPPTRMPPPFDYIDDVVDSMALSASRDAHTESAGAISFPQQDTPADWALAAVDTMQLDNEYMQYFGDNMMDGSLADDALAGFDDWMAQNLNVGDLSGGLALPETSVEQAVGMMGYGWQNNG